MQQFLSAEEAFLPWRSQSPYGAKWFATLDEAHRFKNAFGSRNPLTGLSGLQPIVECEEGWWLSEWVAIPLRG